MNYSDYINKIYGVFINHAKPYTPEMVGWTTKDSQYKRFDVLYNIVLDKSDLILDYGCGFGELINFLTDKEHNTNQYIGLDVNPTYIDHARSQYPNNIFVLGGLTDVTVEFDYILASGAFTVGLAWVDIVKQIKEAYSLTKKGIAFNLLHVNYVEDNNFFYGYDPELVLVELSKLFGNVELIDNYLPGEDFTIYIKKNGY